MCKFSVTAQHSHEPGIVIAPPGQHIELLCAVTPLGRNEAAAWIINHVVHTVQLLHNGTLTGYSSNGSNLIIENIIMNDDRNDTEYSCVTISSTVSNPTFADILDEGHPTILYVAGEYQCNIDNLLQFYTCSYYTHIIIIIICCS